MKIWVDADACPNPIKEIILKATLKRQVETVFVANQPLFLPNSSFVSLVLVEKGPDIADQYIAEHAGPGDLVITQDIPLAAELTSKNMVVITCHGTLLTENNIGERLSIRNLSQELRESGIQTRGPKPFNDRHKQHFANTFDQQLTRLLARRSKNLSP